MRIKRRFKRKMLASLIAISFAMPSAKAESFEGEVSRVRITDLCLKESDQKNLAAYKLNCDTTKLDLLSCRNTLDKCVNAGSPSENWWASPVVVVGGMIAAGILGGFIVAVAK